MRPISPIVASGKSCRYCTGVIWCWLTAMFTPRSHATLPAGVTGTVNVQLINPSGAASNTVTIVVK